MSDTEWTLEKILEREKYYAEGEKKLGKEGAYHTKLYEYLLKVQQDEKENKRKEYRVLLYEENESEYTEAISLGHGLSRRDYGAVLWCILNDVIEATGTNKKVLLEAIESFYEEEQKNENDSHII